MTILLHHRLANWLAALTIALWPAAAAQACGCEHGATTGEDDCSSGCCAAQAEASTCCGRRAADDGICCATSQERAACGCAEQCAHVHPQHKPAGTTETTSAPPAAWEASGHFTPWLASSDLLKGWDPGTITQRPKRILLGVWRN